MWTRLADAAFVVSLGLALPAVMLLDTAMTRSQTIHTVTGQVAWAGGNSRDFRAFVSNPAVRSPDLGVWQDQLFAFFNVHVERLNRGFPTITTEVIRQPLIEFSIFPVRKHETVDLGPDSPIRKAVHEAVMASKVGEAPEIRELWLRGEVVTTRPWWSWVAAILLWWVILFVSLSFLILLARLVMLAVLSTHAVREDARHARGQCLHCGYDLRGLEFSERCPECGELQQ